MPAKRLLMRRRFGGFTLIEVLVALGIMAVMTLLAWRGVQGMGTSAQMSQVHSVNMQRLDATLTQWKTDLDAISVVEGVNALDFDGHRLMLTRRIGAGQPGADARSGLAVVVWVLASAPDSPTSVSGQYLQRWVSGPMRTVAELQHAMTQGEQWSRSGQRASPDATNSASLLPARAWQLFYFRDNAWSNPLSSAGGAGAAGIPAGTPAGASAVTSTAPDALPEGVRLTLTLPPEHASAGVLTLDWVQPTIGATK